MGSSISEMSSSKRSSAPATSSSSSSRPATNNDGSQQATSFQAAAAAAAGYGMNTSQSQQVITKTPEEKCIDISNELKQLANEVDTFSGNKTDKAYLKLEELLTRCLLKLDEIDRGDERVNETRKALINFTHQLADKLEFIANAFSQEHPADQTNETTTPATTTDANTDNFHKE